jgi:mono/diheme cytochrome c family protein
MPPRLRLWPQAVATAVAAASLTLPAVAAGPERPVEFARDVAPLLERSCIRCHRPGNARGDVSLTSRERLTAGGLVVPGRADESALLDVLTPEAPGGRPAMPKQGDPLTEAEVALIRRWIREGAVWPATVVLREKPKVDTNWWSLRPLASPVPPAPTGLPEAWSRHPIDRFIGAGLVAKGLTPSPEADRRTLLRRLTFDLTGLPPTPGEIRDFEADCRPDAYERLVDRLLASPRYGERWGRHWLDVVRFGESTGFERNLILDNAWPFRDYVIRSFNADKPFDRLVMEHLAGDRIGPGDPAVEVGTAFLVCGPYDNVGNQDAAQAAQIRANTIDDRIRAAGESFLGLTVGCARCHDHKFDPILQRDYYALYATFAGVNHGARAVSPAAPPQRGRKPAGGATSPAWWIGQFRAAPGPFRVFLGGDPARKGETVVAASLAALDGIVPAYHLDAAAPESERRLALARWLVAPENPLTPRVLANRLWHYHFGTGIVDTPSDFGVMGGRPSHPELLDWLARQVHAQGWRLKPLHRLIVTSQAYRQGSAYRAAAARADADDRLLWRFPPRRLSAEEVRDAMLAVSGLLDGRMGGPGFRLYRYVEDNVATYVPLDHPGPETYRRTVYHQNARAARVDLLTEFDCPDVAGAAPRRASTTSPLQALTLLNHRFTLDAAAALAARLKREAGADPAAQAELAFRLAFGRGPGPEERTAAAGLVRTRGPRGLARALFNASEFLFVD